MYNAYNEKTTVLLDDSPLKSMHQPWSQVVIPEYDRPEFSDARKAAQHLEMITSNDATPNANDGSSEPGMDNILLGVIGILEAMRGVDNVPAWVRAGHINTPQNIRKDPDPSQTITLDDLPSHESFVPWFKDAAAHIYWVERGRQALARRGIPVSHGLMPDGHGATPERIAAAHARAQRGRSESTPTIISSDGGEVVDEANQESPQETGEQKLSGKRTQKKRGDKRNSRVERADSEAASAKEGHHERRVREDSVADEPRDDVRPGAEPTPFFVQSATGRSTVRSVPRHGRSYSAQAGVRAPPAQPNCSQPAPLVRTFSPSPSPERQARAYSPSMPV